MTASLFHLPLFAESSHQVFRDWEDVTGFDVGWQIALIIFFVLLNGFFVAAEFAIVKVRTSQIDELIEDDRSGKRLLLAKDIVSKLDNYLAATQLGITMASVALSMFGERYIERLIQPFFHQHLSFIGEGWIPVVSFAIAFSFLTFLHVVFGELMPKSLALRRSLATTLTVSKPLSIFEKCFRWAIHTLNGTANWLLKRLFKLEAIGEHEHVHSAEELQLLVAESHLSKQVTPMERDISINALVLNDRVARDVMTPRTEIIALDPREDFQSNLKLALAAKHTRFPLREKNLDVCLGVVHIKDFFTIINEPKPDLVKIKRDIIIVPETQPLDECLKTFLAKRAHMALVVDEFGATVGMVTLEDVMEELVGEIEDEFDLPGATITGFERINPDEFSVDGKLPLYSLAGFSDVDLESDEVSTIGGYITSHLGHLPASGEKTRIENYEVTITSVDSRKILRLHFRRIPEETPGKAEESAV